MDLKQVMAGTQPDPQTQNLINPSKIDTAVRSPGRWRSLSLDVVAVLSAGLFGFTYYRYLTQGLSVWLVLTAITFFAIASVIEMFVAKGGWRSMLVIILEIAAALFFFRRDDIHIVSAIAVIMLAMLAWGHFAGRSRLRNAIEVPFFGASGDLLGKFTTGILLFMILAYVPQIGANALVVSSQSFRSFFDWTAQFVNGFYPGLTLNGSFGDFASSVSKMELQNNPSFQSLSAAQQSAALQQAASQFSMNFASTAASGTVATSTPTSDAFYNVLDGVLSAWQSQSSGWFDVGWVTVLFIGLRAIGIIYVWVAEFLSLMVYELLLALGFMKVTEESRMQEIVGF